MLKKLFNLKYCFLKKEIILWLLSSVFILMNINISNFKYTI